MSPFAISHRRLWLSFGSLLMVAVLCVGVVWMRSNTRRHTAQRARVALDAARAMVAEDPAFARVSVEMTMDEGGMLWFSGNVPSQADADRLEDAFRERFPDVFFTFPVFPVSPTTSTNGVRDREGDG